MIMTELYTTTKRACLLVAAVAALIGCDDGIHGELATKPIYGDMSALYYGGVCRSAGRGPKDPKINAVGIRVNDGGCAVLYLDGVDRQGNLLTYPGGGAVHVDCNGLIVKLQQHHAHARVLARARQECS